MPSKPTISLLGETLPSLDFPGRATLTVREIALKLGYSQQHIIHHMESGELPCLDLRIPGKSKASYRVALEHYHAWILRGIGDATITRPECLKNLSREARAALMAELKRLDNL